MSNKKPDLIAYNVVEGNTDNYWTQIGAAWSNSKGGFNIRLNAMPLSGEIVLLPPKEPKDK